MGTKHESKAKNKRKHADQGARGAGRRRADGSPGRAAEHAEREARKQLRKAVRRAERHIVGFTARLEALHADADASSRAVLESIEATSVTIRARLEETYEELLERRAHIEEMQRTIELIHGRCRQQMDDLEEQETESRRVHRDAIASVTAAEHDVLQRAEAARAVIAAQLEVVPAATSWEMDRLCREAQELLDRAVHEVEVQARAVLHRSTDRVGALLAAVEKQAEDAVAPADSFPASVRDVEVAPADAPSFVPEVEEFPRDFGEWSQLGEAALGEVAPGDDELGDVVPAAEDGPSEDGYAELRAFSWREPPVEETWNSGADEFGEAIAAWSLAELDDSFVHGDSDLQTPGPREEAPGQPDHLPSPTRNGRVVDAPSGRPAALDGTTSVRAPSALLLAAARDLAQRGSEHVLLRLAQRVHSTGARTVLRLDVYDREEWWDSREVPARTRDAAFAPVVVGLGALIETLGTLEPHADDHEVEVVVGSALAIEDHTLARCDAGLVPDPPTIESPTERVNLRLAGRKGLVVKTPNGYVALPPHLVAHLRANGLTDVDLAVSWPTSVLAARTADPGTQVTGRCTALLAVLDDDAPIDRRMSAGNEVAQLVATLSADTGPEELERMLKVGVGYVRRRAAAHPMMSLDLLREILVSGSDAMRAAAASNPSLDAELGGLAVNDRSAEVRAAAAANPELTPKSLTRLAFDSTTHVRTKVAENRRADAEVLALLAKDSDPTVRAAVAQRSDIDVDLLRLLAADVDQAVCAAVAANPSCPEDLLETLVSIVPTSVFENPSAPEALLSAASLLDTARYRVAVARNPATPESALQRLARDDDLEVLRAVASNDAVSEKVRRRVLRRLSAAR